MVRIGVAALAAVLLGMNWRLLTGELDDQAISNAALSLPGLVLAAFAFTSWLWYGLTPPGWLPGGTG